MASQLQNEIDLENAPSVTDLKEKVKQGTQRAMWLRAALLGANDGLLSTASLMLGIGAANSDKKAMIISGIAGGLAGACSMAVGEFISVSTQRDIEKTMQVEESGLQTSSAKTAIPSVPPASVLSPATMNYIASEARLTTLQDQDDEKEVDVVSTESDIEKTMVEQCVAHVNLQGQLGVEAHTKSTVEESGLEATSAKPAIPTAPNKLPPAGDKNSSTRVMSLSRSSTMNYITSSPKPAGDRNSPTRVFSPSRSSTMKCIASEARLTALQEDTKEVDALPNPYKAAAASALSFLCGAFIPLVSTIAISSSKIRFIIIPVVTSIALAAFGGIGAFLGGSPVRVSAMRALFGGWMSMSISYGLLKAFDQ